MARLILTDCVSARLEHTHEFGFFLALPLTQQSSQDPVQQLLYYLNASSSWLFELEDVRRELKRALKDDWGRMEPLVCMVSLLKARKIKLRYNAALQHIYALFKEYSKLGVDLVCKISRFSKKAVVSVMLILPPTGQV